MSADVPWVADDAEQKVDERRVADGLCGRGVVRIRYVEIDYYADRTDPPEPLWHANGFDALDFGLELDLDGGATWSFIWCQAGENEGVLAYAGTLVPAQLRENAGRVWDVTEGSGWSALRGRPIRAVEAAWVRFAWVVRGPSDLCVTTWVLRFEGGSEAVITLGDRDADGEYSGVSPDNIAVFFSVDEAKACGVRLPGDSGE